jgi:hypothetical protein
MQMGVQFEDAPASVRYDIKKSFIRMMIGRERGMVCARGPMLGES